MNVRVFPVQVEVHVDTDTQLGAMLDLLSPEGQQLAAESVVQAGFDRQNQGSTTCRLTLAGQDPHFPTADNESVSA